MQIDQFYDFCNHLTGSVEEFPFDQDVLVFKVGGKIYALTSISKWEQGIPSLILKCEPEKAIDLRERFQGIEPGYHMHKKHWNSVFLNQDVPVTVVLEMIKDSYDLVFKSLPKKVQTEIGIFD